MKKARKGQATYNKEKEEREMERNYRKKREVKEGKSGKKFVHFKPVFYIASCS